MKSIRRGTLELAERINERLCVLPVPPDELPVKAAAVEFVDVKPSAGAVLIADAAAVKAKIQHSYARIQAPGLGTIPMVCVNASRKWQADEVTPSARIS
ncbi:MAG: hypothetical protein ABSH08_13745, partial [Tepidisphaeraceae bacterium]